MKNKLREWLGLEKYTPFEKKYFERALFKAVIYMAVIVIVLECYVIYSVTMNVLTSGKPRTMEWIISHYASYVILLICGIVMLSFASRYVRGKAKNIKAGYGILITFCTVCIVFGIYISDMDYAKGEQILTFLTMEIFVFCLLVWRPLVSFGLLTLTFLVFMFLMNRSIPLTFATELNMMTFWISTFMVSISAYRQRMEDARNNENLQEAYENLEKTAIVDHLTGLSNHAHFIVGCHEILRADPEHASDYTILFLNLVEFKAYNEKYGYDEGDYLLIKSAERLKEAFPGDLIARGSDDHFLILTKRTDAREILLSLDEELGTKHPETHLGLSAGAYRPDRPDCNIAQACDHARYACSSLKKQLRQRFALYDEKMELEVRRRQYIINHVNEAIEQGYVRPFYQPVMFAEDQTLCGAEALARWIDPEFGFLSPGAFIPVLEEYDLIHLVDLCILKTVCRDLRRFMDEGKPAVPVSINFSRRDFANADIPAELERYTAEYRIPKEYLHVEITESALTDDDKLLKETVDKLQQAGYQIWLDDFGSGYSALNVLKDYHFNVMKLDMVFLRNFEGNERAKALIRSIVDMARVMQMGTLTEGVETKEQAEFLRDAGCIRLQGFYFGKPMPLEEIQEKISAGEYTVSPRALDND